MRTEMRDGVVIVPGPIFGRRKPFVQRAASGAPDGRGRPAVEIRTFGAFQVSCAAYPSISSGKAQQKPIALLKLLVAMGGLGTACHIIWDILWPDSDGDLGARNLTITLHRLRHLLGANAAILHHEGKLSLNPDLCWVDVWEFEHLANNVLQKSADDSHSKEWEKDLRVALELYAGHFFSSEPEEAWMLEPRIRWKTRFERIVGALSSHLERNARFDEAIDVCLQALEIDPLNEFIYRRLMACYLERGEASAAARVYTSCCDALAKGLATRPSGETERLYRVAMNGGGTGRPQGTFTPAGMSGSFA